MLVLFLNYCDFVYCGIEPSIYHHPRTTFNHTCSEQRHLTLNIERTCNNISLLFQPLAFAIYIMYITVAIRPDQYLLRQSLNVKILIGCENGPHATTQKSHTARDISDSTVCRYNVTCKSNIIVRSHTIGVT